MLTGRMTSCLSIWRTMNLDTKILTEEEFEHMLMHRKT